MFFFGCQVSIPLSFKLIGTYHNIRCIGSNDNLIIFYDNKVMVFFGTSLRCKSMIRFKTSKNMKFQTTSFVVFDFQEKVTALGFVRDQTEYCYFHR